MSREVIRLGNWPDMLPLSHQCVSDAKGEDDGVKLRWSNRAARGRRQLGPSCCPALAFRLWLWLSCVFGEGKETVMREHTGGVRTQGGSALPPPLLPSPLASSLGQRKTHSAVGRKGRLSTEVSFRLEEIFLVLGSPSIPGCLAQEAH